MHAKRRWSSLSPIELNAKYVFPLSRHCCVSRVMRGLSSEVAYCVLETFERGNVRLVRLRDPWAGEWPALHWTLVLRTC